MFILRPLSLMEEKMEIVVLVVLAIAASTAISLYIDHVENAEKRNFEAIVNEGRVIPEEEFNSLLWDYVKKVYPYYGAQMFAPGGGAAASANDRRKFRLANELRKDWKTNRAKKMLDDVALG